MQNTKIKIFLVEDNLVYGTLVKNSIETEPGFAVEWFRDGTSILENMQMEPDVIILDYMLPEMTGLELFEKIKAINEGIDCVILSGQDDVNVVVQSYKAGIKNYIVKNQNAVIELQNTLKNIKSRIFLKRENEELSAQIIDRKKYKNICGDSVQILNVLKLIQKVENTDILTLITGESGTGKELVAQAIHNNSRRYRKNFVAVNLAAIPADLIESELFGHEKGSFTGASSRRIGKFEEANSGTIFLDEIGEMDITMQTKLLRVLQENKLSRLGSNKEIKLDFRVVVATNNDLSKRVKEGFFREDLFYRIQGFLIHIPPLRDRGGDVMILATNFLNDFCLKNRLGYKTFSDNAVDKMMAYSWPGNVRELKAFVERAALISNDQVITENDLMFSPDITL